MNTALAESWPSGLSIAPAPLESTTSTTSITDEVLTPEQFFVPAEWTGIAWTPERRLLLAVLEDAVVMFLRHRNDQTTRGKRLLRETQEWFASTDQTSVCAFETICDHLNLDAEYLRRGVRRLPEPTSAMRISLNNFLRQPRHPNRRLTVVPAPNCSQQANTIVEV